MGEVTALNDPANYRRAHQRIKKLLEEGNTSWGPHFKECMEERGFQMPDVEHIVKYGEIVDHTMPREYWRYVIDGYSVDRYLARLVVEINGFLMYISIYEKNR